MMMNRHDHHHHTFTVTVSESLQVDQFQINNKNNCKMNMVTKFKTYPNGKA